MTTSQSQLLVFEDLESVAPSVSKLLQAYTAKLNFDLVSGDALNTYGHSFSLKGRVEVLFEQCRLCGETQFTAPVPSCTGHRVERVWRILAESEASGLSGILRKLEPQVKAWMNWRENETRYR